MEQKQTPRPNVRIEPKANKSTASKKATAKDKKPPENELNPQHLAKNKAEEMESGFVRTRKSETPKSSPHSYAVNEAEKEYSYATASDKKKPSTPPKNATEQDDELIDEVVNSTPKVKAGYQITITPSVCTSAVFLGSAILFFTFIFGFISGNWMKSEPVQATPDKLISEKQNNKEDIAVLNKEDLQFLTNLKSDSLQASEEAEQLSTGLVDENIIQIAENAIAPQDKIYDFNLRVAAYRNSEQADKLRERLEGKDLRTRRVVEEDSKGKWYFVHILLRGNEAKLQEVRNTLKSVGIRDSIIKEQKEVK